MKTIFVKDYDEMSQVAYDMVAEVIKVQENPVISMTTGGSPRGMFQLLVENINNGNVDISNTTIMNLDEYIGPKNAPYTVYNFMYEQFYNQINQQPKLIHLIDGETSDTAAEIARYKEVLTQTPRDIQIIGLGTNGHIGANEPGTPFDSEIFLAQHDDSTIQSTMKEYGVSREEAPDEMITLGFTEILAAKQVILVVSGAHKAEAVKNILEGPITEECPASFLQDKANVVMIVDEAAASLLETK